MVQDGIAGRPGKQLAQFPVAMLSSNTREKECVSNPDQVMNRVLDQIQNIKCAMESIAVSYDNYASNI